MGSDLNALVGVQNAKADQLALTRTANGANNRLALHVQLGCGSLSITTSLLVRSVMHEIEEIGNCQSNMCNS